MLFRDATPDDAAGIALVRVAAWQHAYEDIVDPRLVAALDVEDERERWEQRLAVAADAVNRQHVTVVEHDGRALGFTAVLARSREADVPDGTGELAAIYVHPVAQGAGLGPRMLDAAAARLGELDATRATLRVLTANTVARTFFGSRGWRLDGDAPDDAPDGDVPGPTERLVRDFR
ncbi:MAG: GNAT family N-acetyltransferase [Patulibacter sp.]